MARVALIIALLTILIFGCTEDVDQSKTEQNAKTSAIEDQSNPYTGRLDDAIVEVVTNEEFVGQDTFLDSVVTDLVVQIATSFNPNASQEQHSNAGAALGALAGLINQDAEDFPKKSSKGSQQLGKLAVSLVSKIPEDIWRVSSDAATSNRQINSVAQEEKETKASESNSGIDVAICRLRILLADARDLNGNVFFMAQYDNSEDLQHDARSAPFTRCEK